MDKAPEAFRTISEVADEIDVPQHVLRFWESRFSQIRPLKRGGGRRFYRPEDVDLLRGVRHLLYGEGYTIRGVQRIFREQGAAFVQIVWHPGSEQPPSGKDEAEDESGALPDAEDSRPHLPPIPPALRRHKPVGAEHTGKPHEPFPAPAQDPKASEARENDRRKLRAALDDLLASQRLLEAALAADAEGDPRERDREPSA
ncbi:MAG: MerR family transcriptional regulator [Xanthobacteraceae bacterium]